MKKKAFTLFWFAVLSALFILILNKIRPMEKESPYYIAIVGPMTEKFADNGKSITQGAKLYIESINKKGGLNGKEVEGIIFDDKNDPTRARQIAYEIVSQDRFLAVLGHYSSPCSIIAGEIYKQYGIPAISPTSTNGKLTRDNEWYYRTSFTNNLQARYLAHYSKKVLERQSVVILHENKEYGENLAEIFSVVSSNLGVKILLKEGFVPESLSLDNDLDTIVEKAKNVLDQSSAVFLGTRITEGRKLIKLLKDKGVTAAIITPDLFADKTLKDSFVNEARERIRSGFYTEGIYLATPLIFDTANEKAQHFQSTYLSRYGEKPDWQAALAYDSAMLILEAIKDSNVSKDLQKIKIDQRKVRDFLDSIDTIDKSIEGVTGFNYFNEFGDPQKPITLGVYKSGNIVSALTQMQEIIDPNAISDFEKTLNQGGIMLIDDRYLFKTNVVYTGIKIKEISKVDFTAMTCSMDFTLWFRYKEDSRIIPEDIVFLNSVSPINLDSPIQEKKRDGIVYKAFHVKGNFRIAVDRHNYTIRHNELKMNFRHRHLTRFQLIYISDQLGMGLTQDTSSLAEMMRNDHILNPGGNWRINHAWIYQDIGKRDLLGDPAFLQLREGKVDYSRFNIGIQVSKNSFSLRGYAFSYARELVGISAFMLILLYVGKRKVKFRVLSKIFSLLQVVFTITLLLLSETLLIDNFRSRLSVYSLDLTVTVFDVLWWILPALLFNTIIEDFLWLSIEKKTERRIPIILRRFIASVIYTLAFFGIVAFVFDQKLTGLLATSGVFAMIIGLAIQMNISNIFAGIAMNVELPFRVGDWVTIGPDTGRVTDSNWRTTRLLNLNGSIISIPNHLASDSCIHNYNYPDSRYRQLATIHVDINHPPERVVKILYDALISTEGVLKEPPPIARLLELTEWSADYRISFQIRDFVKRFSVRAEVWNQIWTHLNRNGISPAVRRQDIHMFEGAKKRGIDEARNPQNILHELKIFDPLPESDKELLAAHMKLQHFYDNTDIICQGEKVNSLFIIVEGVVRVWIQLDDERSHEITRLGAGNFFGEMALLTDKPHLTNLTTCTDSYAYKIETKDLSPIIERNPVILKSMNEVLTKRKMRSQSYIDKHLENEVSSPFLTKFWNKYKEFRD